MNSVDQSAKTCATNLMIKHIKIEPQNDHWFSYLTNNNTFVFSDSELELQNPGDESTIIVSEYKLGKT